jgi:hypothetical protein
MKGVKKIGIKIEQIEFQIVVSKHETHQRLFIDNIERFLLQANANDDLPIGALSLQSTSSTA